MFYLILAIVVLILSAVLFQRAAGSLSLQKLNMISWIFYYNIFLQSFIASVLVVYKLDFHYFIGKIYSDNSRIYGFYAVMYTMVALPFGMIIFNWTSNRRIKNIYFEKFQKYSLAFEFPYGDKVLRFSLTILSVICIASIVYVFVSIGKIPILTALSGSSTASELSQIRSNATRGFEGIIYIRNIFGILITPILSYIYYSYFKLTGKRSMKVWFIIMALFSLLILTYNLEKSPIIEYIVGFLILRVILNDTINFKVIARFFLIAIVLVISIYLFILQQPFAELFSYNSGFIGRIILGQSTGTYLAFDLFPKYQDFLGFSSLSQQLSGILDLEYSERAARRIMEFYNPKGIEDGEAGVMNSLFIAEAWANFGIVGVIVAPVYVGFVIQFINMHFLKNRKTPINVAILAYLSYNLPVTGGINDFFYSIPILSIFVIFWFIISWSNTLTK